MVIDSKTDDWFRRYWPPQPYVIPPLPPVSPVPTVPFPTALEIEEFRRLLDRAREYDKRHGEPNCELEEKKQKLKDMADKLGVDIAFV